MVSTAELALKRTFSKKGLFLALKLTIVYSIIFFALLKIQAVLY